jgi:Penicillin amidase
LVAVVLLGLLAVGLGGAWHVLTKLPLRKGSVPLERLRAAVTVAYDERGVPHINADNQTDLHRALGYVQEQDRLFRTPRPWNSIGWAYPSVPSPRRTRPQSAGIWLTASRPPSRPSRW